MLLTRCCALHAWMDTHAACKWHETATSLDLSRNDIDDAGVKALVALFGANASLHRRAPRPAPQTRHISNPQTHLTGRLSGHTRLAFVFF